MRRIPIVLALLVVAACQDVPQPLAPTSLARPAALPDAAQERGAVMAGRIVVRLVEGVAATDVAAAHGTTVGERGYGGAFVILRGAAGSEAALAARLASDPRVAWAEPDYLRQHHEIRPELWAFRNPGGRSVTYTTGPQAGEVVTSYLSSADADEDNVEEYAAGGTTVMVGSIDTGVDFGHPEFLPGQLVAGRDWYNDDDFPGDDDDHGTHTTGTMVGRRVGVAGVSGAGNRVRVYVQKVCGRFGCPSSAIANAIRAAADQPNMVAMNMSLGGSTESQAEKDAIHYAVVTRGVLVIASAGNDAQARVSCPACDPLAISVAASNWLDQPAYYTNSGAGLDLTAPGGELFTNTTEEAGIGSSVRGGYAYFQGTSMAAPQVTGTAAIVASKTGLRGSALRARLESSADDLGGAGYDQTFGHGRLNSYRAVTGGTLPGGG